jgi:hypothetical protein
MNMQYHAKRATGVPQGDDVTPTRRKAARGLRAGDMRCPLPVLPPNPKCGFRRRGMNSLDENSSFSKSRYDFGLLLRECGGEINMLIERRRRVKWMQQV